MNIVQKAALLLFALCSYSCIYEESTATKSIIENLSGHPITLTLYDSGTALTQYTQVIENGEKKIVHRGGGRGKNNSFPYTEMLGVMDSVVVSFGATIQAVHYSFNVVGNNRKAIKYDNPRSLFNRASFKRVVTSEKKYSVIDEFHYTFTVQDYMNATR